MSKSIPVVTIDGPGGVGKGTISAMLAEHLGWHYLDSGALYRLTALACEQQQVALDRHREVARLAAELDVKFMPQGGIMLNNSDVEALIRTETCGKNASIVAAIPEVREALLQRQRGFLALPGLVADGRDMGTSIFADAPVKVFLTASATERAKRRHKQLIEKGNDVTLAGLLGEINERDERDMNRSVSPLKPAGDAHTIDTSELNIEEVFQQVLQLCEEM